MSFAINAYAKINLFLNVLGKRSDGYHDVEMIMQSITLHDSLGFYDCENVVLEIKGADLPAGEDNLVVRAVRAVKAYTGCRNGVRVLLEKNIPIAAGLGGGSADAAATIIGLNRLWNLGLSKEEILSLGEKIGSDVPFCLVGGTALAKGRGEIITELPPAPDMGLVLVKPPYGISTAQVYKSLDLAAVNAKYNKQEMLRAIENKDLRALLPTLGNILEEVAVRMHPDILEIKNILLRNGALGTLMSGSGSTVFGITEDLSSAIQLAGKLSPEIGDVFTAGLKRAREVLPG